MIIAVDFDGTCVTHDFPEIGKEIGAAPVLKALFQKGNDIILNTMRSSQEGYVLRDAVSWFDGHDIPLYGVNENPDQKNWTSSPKVYAHLYIDDAALGIPLIQGVHTRPFVNWLGVLNLLKPFQIFSPKEREWLTNEILENVYYLKH